MPIGSTGPLLVAFFQRKPMLGAYSLERLFADVRAALPVDIHPIVRVSRFRSKGLWRRLYNVVQAAFHQGDVNHIVGDVHFLTLLLPRRRTVLTVHDCVMLESSRGLRHWLLWLFWFWLPVRRVEAITVISETTKRELLRYVRCDPSRIHVIPNCVADSFAPHPKPFPNEMPRVLQIGTMPNKNIERLGAALAGVRCHLVIVGQLSDSQRRALESNAIEYENLVTLTDDALLEQYHWCDMLVFASTSEGFGLPIVEANSVGRPVVTSNVSSMPEVAGDAACLVDPYDVQSIRAGIMRVIGDADYRETLISAGYRNVERFRPTAIAAQYATLYRRISRQI